MINTWRCDNCDGDGQVFDGCFNIENCRDCNGTGTLKGEKMKMKLTVSDISYDTQYSTRRMIRLQATNAVDGQSVGWLLWSAPKELKVYLGQVIRATLEMRVESENLVENKSPKRRS